MAHRRRGARRSRDQSGRALWNRELQNLRRGACGRQEQALVASLERLLGMRFPITSITKADGGKMLAAVCHCASLLQSANACADETACRVCKLADVLCFTKQLSLGSHELNSVLDFAISPGHKNSHRCLLAILRTLA